MTLGFVTALRDAQVAPITTQLGTSPKVRQYSGTRPATGGTATTLLVENPMSATPGTNTGGVWTAAAITTANAVATGTAAWFRALTSANVPIIDGTIATSASDLNVNTLSYVSGGPCAVSSWTITAGNL
jgi:hypothetical protein